MFGGGCCCFRLLLLRWHASLPAKLVVIGVLHNLIGEQDLAVEGLADPVLVEVGKEEHQRRKEEVLHQVALRHQLLQPANAGGEVLDQAAKGRVNHHQGVAGLAVAVEEPTQVLRRLLLAVEEEVIEHVELGKLLRRPELPKARVNVEQKGGERGGRVPVHYVLVNGRTADAEDLGKAALPGDLLHDEGRHLIGEEVLRLTGIVGGGSEQLGGLGEEGLRVAGGHLQAAIGEVQVKAVLVSALFPLNVGQFSTAQQYAAAVVAEGKGLFRALLRLRFLVENVQKVGVPVCRLDGVSLRGDLLFAKFGLHGGPFVLVYAKRAEA